MEEQLSFLESLVGDYAYIAHSMIWSCLGRGFCYVAEHSAITVGRRLVGVGLLEDTKGPHGLFRLSDSVDHDALRVYFSLLNTYYPRNVGNSIIYGNLVIDVCLE